MENKKWLLASFSYIATLGLLALSCYQPWLISNGFLPDYYFWDSTSLLIPVIAFGVLAVGTGMLFVSGALKRKAASLIHVLVGAAGFLYALYVWTEVSPSINLFDFTTMFMQFTSPGYGLYSFGASSLCLLLGGSLSGE